MKTLKKIPVEVKRVNDIPEKLEENVIYVSGMCELAIHSCLCGCGKESVTPIDKNGWTLEMNKKGATMKPSILNKNCPNKYHYIITDGVANVV